MPSIRAIGAYGRNVLEPTPGLPAETDPFFVHLWQRRLRTWAAIPIVALAVGIVVHRRHGPWQWSYLLWGLGVAAAWTCATAIVAVLADNSRRARGRTTAVSLRQRMELAVPQFVMMGAAAGVLSAALRTPWFDIVLTALMLLNFVVPALITRRSRSKRRR